MSLYKSSIYFKTCSLTSSTSTSGISLFQSLSNHSFKSDKSRLSFTTRFSSILGLEPNPSPFTVKLELPVTASSTPFRFSIWYNLPWRKSGRTIDLISTFSFIQLLHCFAKTFCCNLFSTGITNCSSSIL